MAIVWDAPVTPDQLTFFMRSVPLPDDFTLSAMFGTRKLDTGEYDFMEIVRTNRTARYRAPDGRIHISERDVGDTKKAKIAILSSALTEGEYERLQREFARVGGTRTSRIVAAIYNDGQQLTREVQARIELAWGDVLADGKLTINESGYAPGEADFGVPASQKHTAAVAWTDTTNAVPLTDMLTWQQARISNGNAPAATQLTSLRMLSLLRRNKEIIDATFGATEGRTRVSIAELNDLLSGEGLPTMRPAYDTQVDVDGTPTRVLPDNKVVWLPADLNNLGYTADGVTATALELVDSKQSELSFEDAPGIVGVVEKVGPPYRKGTFVDAAKQPVLSNARNASIVTAA